MRSYLDWQTLPIYLHRDPVDFRKAVNGLSAIVEQDMGLASLSGALFVFCNKRRDKVKALYWDSTGFCLWHKCLEQAKFGKRPAIPILVNRKQLCLN